MTTKYAGPVVVAHAGAGKTTAAKALPNVFLDIDDFRDPAREPELKMFREAGDWENHNRLWHEIARARLPYADNRILVLHSAFDANGIAGKRPDAYVLIPPRVRDARADEIRKTDPHRADMILKNWDTVAKEVQSAGAVPVFASFEELLRTFDRTPVPDSDTGACEEAV